MKNFLSQALFLLSAVVTFSAKGDVYDHYYKDMPVEIKCVSTFDIPEAKVSITEFGGIGDAVTLNTEAFANAISRLEEMGGGHLVVPQGIWLTGPIELKSNIDLHLERNAVIYFSPDRELYIDSDPKASRVLPCIRATRCRNISITGEGTIDGNGAQWRPVKRSKVSDVEWRRFKEMGGVERQNGSLWYPWEMKSGYPDISATPEKQEGRRNDIFRIYHCENVFLSGVTFQNAPKFHVHPFNSRNLIIDGITVRCPWNAQNGDAIDLSDCHQALVVNSIVDAGDDGICMKSGEYKKDALVNGCEDILIQDNIVYHAHGGFVIGSEDICGMKRIVVRDCTFSGTETGLRFKSAIGRGGKTEDIFISGIMMTDIIHQAIVFECNYANRPAGVKDTDLVAQPVKMEKVPEFTDIHISDVICRGAKVGIAASGLENFNCVHGITISNSTIIYTSKATEIDERTAQIQLNDVRLVPDRKQ
ncbi:MAG: glycoside hydrolase family 28 protein [Duncaniella sp.]|nr:glycoside hydrolase family 28 protein [Duncaniella sp.]